MLTLIAWIPVSAARGGMLQLKSIDISGAKTAVVDSSGQDINVIVQDMQEFCEERGATPKQAMYIGLTIEEICCAVMERFRDRMGKIYVQVTAVMEEGDVTLYLRDNAYEFNPFAEDTDAIRLAEGEKLELVGLRIVQSKAKEFYYRRYSGFNTLVIRM